MSNPEILFTTLTRDDPAWLDIEGKEKYRVYRMISGNTLLIENPVALLVKRKPEGDSHRIIDAEGKCHYLPAGMWENFTFLGDWKYQSVNVDE